MLRWKSLCPENLAPSLPGGYNPLHADYINKLKLFSVAQINFPNPIICDKSREKKMAGDIFNGVTFSQF